MKKYTVILKDGGEYMFKANSDLEAVKVALDFLDPKEHGMMRIFQEKELIYPNDTNRNIPLIEYKHALRIVEQYENQQNAGKTPLLEWAIKADLSIRCFRVLTKSPTLKYIEDVTEDWFYSRKNAGRRSWEEIQHALNQGDEKSNLDRNDYIEYIGGSRSMYLTKGEKYRLTCSPFQGRVAIINEKGRRTVLPAWCFKLK